MVLRFFRIIFPEYFSGIFFRNIFPDNFSGLFFRSSLILIRFLQRSNDNNLQFILLYGFYSWYSLNFLTFDKNFQIFYHKSWMWYNIFVCQKYFWFPFFWILLQILFQVFWSYLFSLNKVYSAHEVGLNDLTQPSWGTVSVAGQVKNRFSWKSQCRSLLAQN